MIAKFNFYEFISILIPGILFIWAVFPISNFFGVTFNIPFTGELSGTSILIVLAFVIGLLLQGISQGVVEKILVKLWGGFPSARWLLPDDNYFSKDFKSKLKQIVENIFKIKIDINLPKKEQMNKNQEIFYLCYNTVIKEKLSDRPQIFNVYYGLFRCLLTTFLLLFLTSVIIFLFNRYSYPRDMLIILIFSFFGLIISYLRTKKRAEDFAKSIYELFIVNYSDYDSSE